jgi:hypothetical protein
MMGGYIAVAIIVVFGSWLFKRGSGEIAPAWAVTCSLLYLSTLLVGGWLVDRHSDEVERRDNLFAAGFAAGFYGLAFPVWHFLAKGQLVTPPDRLVVFAGFVVMAAVGYMFKKLT